MKFTTDTQYLRPSTLAAIAADLGNSLDEREGRLECDMDITLFQAQRIVFDALVAHEGVVGAAQRLVREL
jgi:hypothetical protein